MLDELEDLVFQGDSFDSLELGLLALQNLSTQGISDINSSEQVLSQGETQSFHTSSFHTDSQGEQKVNVSETEKFIA